MNNHLKDNASLSSCVIGLLDFIPVSKKQTFKNSFMLLIPCTVLRPNIPSFGRLLHIYDF